MHFRWKIKWRLEHLGALRIMGEMVHLISWDSLSNKKKCSWKHSRQNKVVLADLWAENWICECYELWVRGPPLITHLFVAVDETEEVFNQMISNIRSNKDTNLKNHRYFTKHNWGKEPNIWQNNITQSSWESCFQPIGLERYHCESPLPPQKKNTTTTTKKQLMNWPK